MDDRQAGNERVSHVLQGGTAGVTLPAHLQAAVKGGGTPGTSGKAELSWLMRTTYISSDVAERRQQGMSEKRAKAMRQAHEEAPADSREAQMDAIEVELPPSHAPVDSFGSYMHA